MKSAIFHLVIAQAEQQENVEQEKLKNIILRKQAIPKASPGALSLYKLSQKSLKN